MHQVNQARNVLGAKATSPSRLAVLLDHSRERKAKRGLQLVVDLIEPNGCFKSVTTEAVEGFVRTAPFLL